MIRAPQKTDLDAVADIWLSANLSAHDFIPAQYWQGHFAQVKELLAQAELYVYEEEREIQGFIGLDGSYIAGIFVHGGARSRGIGKALLDYAKTIKTRLSLSVYRKNTRAAAFYRREGFVLVQEGVDGETGEREYVMEWGR